MFGTALSVVGLMAFWWLAIRSRMLSRAQVSSHRSSVAYPARVGDIGGFPASPNLPRLNGRKRIFAPASRVGSGDQFRVDREVGEATPVGEQRLPREAPLAIDGRVLEPAACPSWQLGTVTEGRRCVRVAT